MDLDKKKVICWERGGFCFGIKNFIIHYSLYLLLDSSRSTSLKQDNGKRFICMLCTKLLSLVFVLLLYYYFYEKLCNLIIVKLLRLTLPHIWYNLTIIAINKVNCVIVVCDTHSIQNIDLS